MVCGGAALPLFSSDCHSLGDVGLAELAVYFQVSVVVMMESVDVDGRAVAPTDAPFCCYPLAFVLLFIM